MPWNGASPNKTFGRTDGTRTGSTTWQQADAASVDIISPDHDTHDQDIADGLNTALCKDGGNTATANIPMGGFTFSNLAAASGPLNPARLTDALISGYAATVGGTANAITLTTGYTFTAYAAGQEFSFIVGTTNTGAVTVNVDSIGAKNLVRNDGSHTALSAGDLVSGALATVRYDGTRFKLISANATGTSADVLARIVKVGSILPWPTSTVPAGWLECYGQAISRTDYAELFSALGTTYGVGDGSTTFNLPDMRGRSIFGEDDMGGSSADRLTGLTNGVNGDTLGTTGGLESTTIAQANLPNINLTAQSNGDHVHTYSAPLYGGNTVGDTSTNAVSREPITQNTSTNGAHTHTVPLGGSGTPINNVPPAIILKWIILALPAAASASTIGVNGFLYQWDTGTTDADPGSGKLRVNNATLASATQLYISETGANAESLSAVLATWDDSGSTVKGHLYLYKVGAPGTYAYFALSGNINDAGSYDKFTIAHVGSNGSFSNGDNLSVLFHRTGDIGNTGATGVAGADAGIKYNFDSSTSMADPGSGDVRLNSATLSSVTAIAVSDLCAESGGPDVSTYVLAWDDSTTLATRGTLIIKKDSAPENFVIYTISGSSTDNSGWTQLAVTYVTHAGAFSNADSLVLQFLRTGDVGSGAGDVQGPASATDNAIALFDGTTGKVIQNSAVTMNETTGVTTGMVFPNTGLNVQDTNASHNLGIVPGSNITANRTLTLTTGDANRTVTISGDATISQDYSTSGNPQFATIELGHASANTLSASGGALSIEGVEVTTNTAAQTLTNKTLTAPKIANAGFIADANGNEQIIFTTTAAAVNEVTYNNAATGANPKFSATGGDSNVGIDFQAKGTGVYNFLSTADQASEIRLFEDTSDGAHYTAFKPQAQAGNITYTLPPNDGNASEVLTTDGSGSLSWTAPAGSGDVTAASSFGTDNVLIRSDGTGKGVQHTGITADDSNNISGFPNLIIMPQGRLTVATATPVVTTTDSANTIVYYTPYIGNVVPIYNGTVFVNTVFAELLNTTSNTTHESGGGGTGGGGPAAVTTDSNYDLFVWNDSGTIKLTRGPLWTSSTARGTGAGTTELERVSGIYVNKIAITNGPAAQRGTYVGTVRSNGSSQIDWIFGARGSGTTGTAGFFGVWNMYNRVDVTSSVNDGTTSWTYNTNAWRSSNNSATNRHSFISGIADDAFSAVWAINCAANTSNAQIGIGLDATTALASGCSTGSMFSGSGLSNILNVFAHLHNKPVLGFHFVQAIETNLAGSGTNTFYGNGTNAVYENGLHFRFKM